MEKIPSRNIDYIPPEIEDFSNRVFFPLLKRIPSEHMSKHLIYIEDNALSDEEATEYINDIIELRTEALTETFISDESLLERIKNQQASIFKHLETDVFSNQENYLGSGMTAKVKYFEIQDLSTKEILPIAVKYLVTPTKMTLSASAEHDMLVEVERIQTIENLEADAGLRHIKVPHPYFHHRNSEIQCYAMELIDGFDLSKEIKNMPSGEEKKILIETLATTNLEDVEKEIETFFTRMHEYCLHMMVGRDGTFYVIDFGQSRLVTDIPDNAREQLYTLQEDEIAIAKAAVRTILSEAKGLVADM
jgi:serine/threonine protein kinase